MTKMSEKEREYFHKLEEERKRGRAEEVARRKAEAEQRAAETERARRRELHHMKCPKCGGDLVEIDHRGIKVDRCDGCAGVWLDAGELEAVVALDRSFLTRWRDGLRKKA